MRTTALLMLVMSLVLISSACGGQHSAEQGAVPESAQSGPASQDLAPVTESRDGPALPQLPSLAELERQADSAEEYSEFWKKGSSTTTVVKLQELMFNFSEGTYSPGFKEQSGQMEYALGFYTFSLSESPPGEPMLRLIWNGDAPAADLLYIGIADYSSGRWKWQQYPQDGLLLDHLSDMQSAGGKLHMVVLLGGNQEKILDRIVIGDVPPAVHFTDNHSDDGGGNVAPFLLMVDATSTEPVSYPIVSFDFDFDGDGTWDLLGDEDGIVSTTLGPGFYDIVVRATDAGGLSDTSNRNGVLSFMVVDPGTSPPVPVLEADLTSGPAPLSVTIDPSGSYDPDGTIEVYEWDFNNDGEGDKSTNKPDLQTITLQGTGTGTVSLSIRDDQFKWATGTIDFEITAGWHSNELATGLDVADDFALATVGIGEDERAVLACLDLQQNEVRFSRSLDAGGAVWTDFLTVTGESIAFAEDDNIEMLPAGDGSALLIAYDVFEPHWEVNRHELNFLSSADVLGDSWNAVQVLDDTDNTGLCELELLNGLPCIGGIENQSVIGGQPVLLLAENALGADWKPAVKVFANDGTQIYDRLDISHIEVDGVQWPVAVAGVLTGSLGVHFSRQLWTLRETTGIQLSP